MAGGVGHSATPLATRSEIRSNPRGPWSDSQMPWLALAHDAVQDLGTRFSPPLFAAVISNNSLGQSPVTMA